ncbi:MAG: thioredoxin domain-containing protein [Candidatus Competibacterales bacterium]
MVHPHNALTASASPHLRLHAHQPIHWFPWGSEALELAQRQSRPLFVAIGYAASQGCRRMAATSFADEAVAAVLNREFVNIKVDCLERPDLDQVYQAAHRLLNGQPGGWPLNLVMTPDDQVPFFAATYLPHQAENGWPGFADLMTRLADLFRNQQSQIRAQNRQLWPALEAGVARHGATGYSLHPGPLEAAVQAIIEQFDADTGGFGRGPKFPQPGWWNRLLRHGAHSLAVGREDRRIAPVVEGGLSALVAGKVFDANRGGFFRHSKDPAWRQPQGEKLLCDNARLIALLARARAFWGLAALDEPLAATIHWASATLRRESGLFAAAQYLEGDGDPLAEDAAFAVDPQVLTAWNAAMIHALALAGRLGGSQAWVVAAETTWEALWQRLWRGGGLGGIDREDGSFQPGCLDDYVLAMEAVMELLQCRWRDADFARLTTLATAVLEGFNDPRKRGGFHLTAHDHEPLVTRLKPVFEGLLPAGNGIAVQVMMRLGRLLNSLPHLLAAERALKYAWPAIERTPLSCITLVTALEDYYFPGAVVVIRGSPGEITTWQGRLTEGYRPRRWVLAIPDAADLPEALAQRAPVARGTVVAYVGRGVQWHGPLASLEAVEEALSREDQEAAAPTMVRRPGSPSEPG